MKPILTTFRKRGIPVYIIVSFYNSNDPLIFLSNRDGNRCDSGSIMSITKGGLCIYGSVGCDNFAIAKIVNVDEVM